MYVLQEFTRVQELIHFMMKLEAWKAFGIIFAK